MWHKSLQQFWEIRYLPPSSPSLLASLCAFPFDRLYILICCSLALRTLFLEIQTDPYVFSIAPDQFRAVCEAIPVWPKCVTERNASFVSYQLAKMASQLVPKSSTKHPQRPCAGQLDSLSASALVIVFESCSGDWKKYRIEASPSVAAASTWSRSSGGAHSASAQAPSADVTVMPLSAMIVVAYDPEALTLHLLQPSEQPATCIHSLSVRQQPDPLLVTVVQWCDALLHARSPGDEFVKSPAGMRSSAVLSLVSTISKALPANDLKQLRELSMGFIVCVERIAPLQTEITRSRLSFPDESAAHFYAYNERARTAKNAFEALIRQRLSSWRPPVNLLERLLQAVRSFSDTARFCSAPVVTTSLSVAMPVSAASLTTPLSAASLTPVSAASPSVSAAPVSVASLSPSTAPVSSASPLVSALPLSAVSLPPSATSVSSASPSVSAVPLSAASPATPSASLGANLFTLMVSEADSLAWADGVWLHAICGSNPLHAVLTQMHKTELGLTGSAYSLVFDQVLLRYKNINLKSEVYRAADISNVVAGFFTDQHWTVFPDGAWCLTLRENIKIVPLLCEDKAMERDQPTDFCKLARLMRHAFDQLRSYGVLNQADLVTVSMFGVLTAGALWQLYKLDWSGAETNVYHFYCVMQLDLTIPDDVAHAIHSLMEVIAQAENIVALMARMQFRKDAHYAPLRPNFMSLPSSLSSSSSGLTDEQNSLSSPLPKRAMNNLGLTLIEQLRSSSRSQVLCAFRKTDQLVVKVGGTSVAHEAALLKRFDGRAHIIQCLQYVRMQTLVVFLLLLFFLFFFLKRSAHVFL